MATILAARGRMTKDLVTPYEVGQKVVLIDPQFDDPLNRARFRVGRTGTIRKVIISAPGDGDATFPMFYVRFGGRTSLFHADEFAPAAEVDVQELHALHQEAHAPRPRWAEEAWLRRVLDDLKTNDEKEG